MHEGKLFGETSVTSLLYQAQLLAGVRSSHWHATVWHSLNPDRKYFWSALAVGLKARFAS